MCRRNETHIRSLKTVQQVLFHRCVVRKDLLSCLELLRYVTLAACQAHPVFSASGLGLMNAVTTFRWMLLKFSFGFPKFLAGKPVFVKW